MSTSKRRQRLDRKFAHLESSAPRLATRAREEPQPDWALSTPDPMEFRLTVFDSGGDEIEAIADITRDEYIELKACLAKMRGIPFQGHRSAFQLLSESYSARRDVLPLKETA
jgi:hypothetical protein